MKTFVSTGGLGDSLIVLAKILQNEDQAYWFHGTSNEEHMVGIQQIQSLLPEMICVCEQIPNRTHIEFGEKNKKLAIEHHTEYVPLNTKIIEMENPFLLEPLVEPVRLANICIQMTAGRLGDSTKRVVSPQVINDILKTHPGIKIVLIGPEEVGINDHPDITNLTGKTPSILDTFAIIGGSDYFVGSDGVCAYYAAFLGIKCSINYHVHTLVDHYWSPKWKNVRASFQYNTMRFL